LHSPPEPVVAARDHSAIGVHNGSGLFNTYRNAATPVKADAADRRSCQHSSQADKEVLK